MLRVTLILLLLTSSFKLSIEDKAVFLYPKNSVFQLTLGVSTPITTGKRGTLSFSAGFQFNYVLPSNLSQFETKILPARDIKAFNLQDIYTSIENLFDKYGWRHGRQCLLRSICELAETPLGKNSQDILEKIIHLLLTPTEDLPEVFNSTHQSVDKLYRQAEQLGKSGGDCVLTYPDCIESPLESFTKISLLNDIQ